MNRKCAIYNEYSNQNEKEISQNRLIDFCHHILKIKDYDLYEEQSTNNSRNEIFNKIKDKDYTDVLVISKNVLSKDIQEKMTSNISDLDIKIHSIEEPNKDEAMYYIDAYNDLIKMDQIYEKKYETTKGLTNVEELFLNTLNGFLKWKNISNNDDIIKCLSDEENGKELLRIEDAYSDEIVNVYFEVYGKDISETIEDENEEGLAYTDENMKNILNNQDTPEKLKDCIKIYLKSELVCKGLYEIFFKQEYEQQEPIIE